MPISRLPRLGLAVADLMTGAHLAQGILACLVRRGIKGIGGHVEVSLLESVLDFQFEVLTTHLNDGGKSPTAVVSTTPTPTSGHPMASMPPQMATWHWRWARLSPSHNYSNAQH
jgi:crotonobetainyl-CoA:carnitine CoA-transferase CaiB-like acyl-CoA transferase